MRRIYYSSAWKSILGKAVPEALSMSRGCRQRAYFFSQHGLTWAGVNNIFIFFSERKQGPGLGKKSMQQSSVWVRGRDKKIPPTAGTNQIAYFTEFCLLKHWEKIISHIKSLDKIKWVDELSNFNHTCRVHVF